MLQPAPPPPPGLDRRSVIRGGMTGLGLVATPAWAAPGAQRGFTHGVASGEPGPASVLLWTRYVADRDVTLRYELAETGDFAKVTGGGEAIASPARDGCAKAVARGLAPGRWYHYRFIAPDGAVSPVGRTRTLPLGRVDRFRMAVVSCSNLGFGWFNAYAHAVADGGFDLVAHLGDYLYEYPRDEYPSRAQALPERYAELGLAETVALADYRQRHADYRADRDLQRLFQLYPWVMIWDDHESANDAWRGGAENHDEASEGPWRTREAASLKAYREWLPVSDERWRAYDIGDLATLFRLDTRLTGRDLQFDYATIAQGTDAQVSAALGAFRDGAWRDPARQLLGPEQEAWLVAGLAASRRSGRTWQVLAQQVVMGALNLPRDLVSGLRADAPAKLRQRIANAVAASSAGLPFNLDAWDGYPAARDRVLAGAQAADANLIVLAGDSHNAWANNLMAGKAAAGVEFGGHSVTSPGTESSLSWIDPERFAREVEAVSPKLEWCDTRHRGYMAVELTPARASCEWRFIDTIRQRSTRLAGSHTLATEPGRNAFV